MNIKHASLSMASIVLASLFMHSFALSTASGQSNTSSTNSSGWKNWQIGLGIAGIATVGFGAWWWHRNKSNSGGSKLEKKESVSGSRRSSKSSAFEEQGGNGSSALSRAFFSPSATSASSTSLSSSGSSQLTRTSNSVTHSNSISHVRGSNNRNMQPHNASSLSPSTQQSSHQIGSLHDACSELGKLLTDTPGLHLQDTKPNNCFTLDIQTIPGFTPEQITKTCGMSQGPSIYLRNEIFVRNDHSQMQRLFDAKATLAGDSNGTTLAHMAAKYSTSTKMFEVIEQQQKNKHDGNNETPILSRVNNNQETPMWTAAAVSNNQAVKILLDLAPKTANVPNNEGNTPLHIAVINDYINPTTVLLEKHEEKPEVVDVTLRNGQRKTAFETAFGKADNRTPFLMAFMKHLAPQAKYDALKKSEVFDDIPGNKEDYLFRITGYRPGMKNKSSSSTAQQPQLMEPEKQPSQAPVSGAKVEEVD